MIGYNSCFILNEVNDGRSSVAFPSYRTWHILAVWQKITKLRKLVKWVIYISWCDCLRFSVNIHQQVSSADCLYGFFLFCFFFLIQLFYDSTGIVLSWLCCVLCVLLLSGWRHKWFSCFRIVQGPPKFLTQKKFFHKKNLTGVWGSPPPNISWHDDIQQAKSRMCGMPENQETT